MNMLKLKMTPQLLRQAALALLLAGAIQFPAAAVDYPTNGLMFYWKLDEATGLTATDSSGNGRDGTFTGFPGDNTQWITGYTNGGVHFAPTVSGSTASGMAIVSPSLGTMTSTTWAAWCRVNTNSPNSFGNVIGVGIGVGAGHNLGFDTSGKFPRLLWNNGATPSTTIASTETIDTNWNHLAVTWDAGTSNLTLYVNGAAKANSTTAGGRSWTTINVGRRGNQQFAYKDDIDEIFVYNRALTPLEIGTLAGIAAGPPQIISPPKSLVVWQGDTATFSVSASGTPSPTYQWYRNGALLSQATASSLVISNAQSTNAGSYVVVVTNISGVLTSSPAAMLAIRPLTNIPPSLPSWIPSAGLVFYWNLDQTTQYAAWDYSGHQNHGALAGFPFDGSQQVDGFIAKGLKMYPADPNLRVEISNLPMITNTTWAAWVKLLQPLGAATILSATFTGAAQGHNLGFDNTSTTTRHPRVLWNNGVAQSIIVSPEPVDEEWNHIAMTYDQPSQTLKLFVNGKPEGSLQPATSTPFSSLNLGRRITTGLQQFGGLIDEVVVYDRALPAEEIQSLFANSLAQGTLPFRYIRLHIEDIRPASTSQLQLTLRTLWPDRPHKLEAKHDFADAQWQEISGVTFEVLSNNMIRAIAPITGTSNLLIRAVVSPPPPVFFDDFETGGAGWTHGGQNDNWEVGKPTASPDVAHSGTNVYATGLADNYNGEADAYLRSPAISLVGVTNATLQFWEFRDIFSNINFHRGLINILDAGTLAVIAEVYRVAGATDGWEQQTITLPAAAAGKSIIVEFRIQSDPFDTRPGWAIDDVAIQP